MPLFYILFALCLSLSFGKYSYTDSCYRCEKVINPRQSRFFQVYVNRKGIPLSKDEIHYYRNGEHVLAFSYYYHNVLTDCNRVDGGFNCTNTCESGWFKIWNGTAMPNYGKYCDKAFFGKYENVLEYSCKMGPDPLGRIRSAIGKSHVETIAFDGKRPVIPQGYTKNEECIWEYDILGLWSMVTLVIVCSVIVVAVLILIALVVFVQKHRSDKRKRLEGSLVRNENMAV